MDDRQLDRIENSLESLHLKLDSVCEKTAAHGESIKIFKAVFGGMAMGLVAIIAYLVRAASQ